MYDVCIIGAGIAGCACARELAAYDLDIVVLEAGYDISCGTTRANSGIIHAGYDPKPGTLKARYNVAGSRMFPKLAEELGFDYRNCGSLVVAFSAEEKPALEKLLARGIANGIEGLRIIEADELREREPNIGNEAQAALWVPTGAIADPYGACLAFAENAAENGVAFHFETYATDVSALPEGGWRVEFGVPQARIGAPDDASRIVANIPEVAGSLDARIVINAAGLEAGRLNNLVSSHKIRITPRVGEYVLLDAVWGDAFNSTVFQVPTKAGKGVLVTPTVEGNLLVGPNAQARKDAWQTPTTTEGLASIIASARRTWPNLPAGDAITNFAGLRASCIEEPDFHLGEPEDAPGFFNIAGFDSPGLTSAPAIAVEYAQTIAGRLDANPRPNYNPRRARPLRFTKLTADELACLVAQDPTWGRIVCRCEQVTEAEIVAALSSPLPTVSTDAIKWRTRAGMGRCQAGFCLPRTAELIARERGLDALSVRKGWVGSELFVGRRGCFDDLPAVVLPEEA